VQPFVPGANADLTALVTGRAAPYDEAADRYDVRAFDEDLIGQKTSALYTFHTYWSKKDPVLIRRYIAHYTTPRDLILDPFCGSGTTGLAAALDGRAAVLIDASPSAALLSHFCCAAALPGEVDEACARLLGASGEEVDALFATRCDRCGGGALTEYVVWSERFRCGRCAEPVALFDCPEVEIPIRTGGRRAQEAARQRARVCPRCLARSGGAPDRAFIVSTRSRKLGAIPVLVRYRCDGACKPRLGERRHDEDRGGRKGRFFEEHDLAKIRDIARAPLPYPCPARPFPRGYRYHRDALWNAGVETVADLYTRRNLWALGCLRHALNERLGAVDLGRIETLLFMGLLHKCSNLMAYNSDGVGRVTKGTYYVAPLRMECRPTKYLREAVADLKRHFSAKADAGFHGGDVVLSTGDAARELRRIPDSSIDYVFTDPPYVDKIQYGELNLLWESWLDIDDAWVRDEIVVNEHRGKGMAAWEAGVRGVLSQIHRVLKPGRWMSLCFHDTDPGTWARLQAALSETGFGAPAVTALRSRQRSANQINGENIAKSDLVLHCRKRVGPAREPPERGPDVSRRVREVLVEELSERGEQTRDRLWDAVLKRLLSRGEMADHRFDDILRDVALRSASGRWRLKE
jgi:16S rRNA G966 N2-methylase RsmD